MCASIVFVGWTGAWVGLSGTFDRAVSSLHSGFIEQSAKAGLKVDDILVRGRNRLDAEYLLAAIDVRKGDPILSLKPQNIHKRIERISWIDSASVQLRYPDTLYIEVQEREPLALWHKDNDIALIDRKGIVLTRDHLHKYKNYPIVTGEEANKNAFGLLQMIEAEPDLMKRIKAAAFIGQRRWDLKLNNGIILHLPESDVGLSLSRLMKAHKKNGLLDKDIMSIDARHDDRLIIKTKPGAVQTIRSGGPRENEQRI